jgi:hypothetical protein
MFWSEPNQLFDQPLLKMEPKLGPKHGPGTGSDLFPDQERPDSQHVLPHRTDIADRWDEDSDRLHNWGILR